MKIISILIFFTLLPFEVKPQDIPEKFRVYKAKVKLFNNKKDVVGSIYLVQDSSITLINTMDKESIREYRFQPISIPIKEIKKMKVRRAGKSGKSIAVGAATGMGLAAAIGITEGPDDCLKTDWCRTVGEKVTMYGFIFVPMGSIIGAIVSAPSKTFYIYGSMDNYNNNNKANLNNYAIIKKDASIDY